MKLRLSALWVCLTLALVLVIPSQVFSAPPESTNLKIAYVNIQQVLESYGPYREAAEQLQQYEQRLKERMESEKSELDQMRSQMQEEGQFLSPEQQEKKRQEMMQKMQSLRQRAQRSQQMVQQKRREVLAPIFDTATDAVAQTGRDLGYDVIYRFDPSRDGNILWIAEKVNITSQMIDRLDNMSQDSSE